MNSAYIAIIIMCTLNIYQKIGYDFYQEDGGKVCVKEICYKIRKKIPKREKITCSRGRSFQNTEVNCRKNCIVLKAGSQDSKDGESG